jgi:hypothetical protein
MNKEDIAVALAILVFWVAAVCVIIFATHI